MTEGIRQPENLHLPDKNDPLEWAKQPRIRTQWLREVCPQLGLDSSKIITTLILDSCGDDDGNPFFAANIKFNPERGLFAKQEIMERMDWELSCPETPPVITKAIRETIETVTGLDWTIEEDFKKAKTHWQSQVCDMVRVFRKAHPDLVEAEKYARVVEPSWTGYYQEFTQRD